MYLIIEDLCRKSVNLHPELKGIWGTMNYTDNFGALSYLRKKYNTSDYQSFYDSYIEDAVENSKTNGRSESYLSAQAFSFSEKDGNRLAINVYYNYILQKLFIDTIDGALWEMKAKGYLEGLGYTIQEPTYDQDRKEGIDMFVEKDGKPFCIVQVKPISFFRGNYNKRLIEDRKLAIQKEQLCRDKYGVPVYYMIYNKDSNNWVHTNGKKAHSITSLISNTGLTKNLI